MTEPMDTLGPTTDLLRDALHQAGAYIKDDEVAHGREFSAGRAVRAALEALTTAAPPAPVVKGLEWDDVSNARSDEDPRREPSGDYEAETPFGFYYIEMYFGTDSYGWKVTFDSLPVADTDDPDAAKAAAQANYEARIHSALVSPPAPAVRVKSKIAEVIAEESEGGAACGWRSCTGCHETNEGYETGDYPFSEDFGCYLGSGCSECGGLGAVWVHYSKKDLEEMSKEHPFVSPPSTSPEREEAKRLADILDDQECCQSVGGPGGHPSRCKECPRNAADFLRRIAGGA